MSKRTMMLTCDEFKEMAGAFALGLLDDAERLDCVAHLGGDGAPHAGCQAALAQARDVGWRLAAALPPSSPPAADLWRGIEVLISQPPPANANLTPHQLAPAID